MDLKRDHTLRVCENILDIGRSLGLCAIDLHLAETIALLHDIGRFEQYRRYKTFLDHQPEDHAALGITIIHNQKLLSAFDPETAEIILHAVKYHNRFALPKETNRRPCFS
ncbi:HD domain-containing protein [Desulfosalsimonas propionicica]|uniref:HD domain-containing protein n=1 Tax=Desulfosalsimonas propionicica TaxID=332175 RepID=UPI0015ECC320